MTQSITTTTDNGRMTLEAAVNLRSAKRDQLDSMQSEYEAYKRAPENELTVERKDFISKYESLEKQIAGLNKSIEDNLIASGLTGKQYHALIEAIDKKDPAFYTMIDNMKEVFGKDIHNWDGLLTDSNLDNSVKLLYRLGFTEPEDIIHHIDWKFTDKDGDGKDDDSGKTKEETVEEIIDEIEKEEEDEGPKPDFGSIKGRQEILFHGFP